MAEVVTRRELEKIRTDIHDLRDRFSLMLSRAGGHINGQVDLEGWLQLDERAAPSQPATDKGRLYAKSDGLIYWEDDGGTEYDLTSGGGGAGAPANAQYLTLALDDDLTGERRFVAGTGLSEVDDGPDGDYTLSVDDYHARQHDIDSVLDHSASGLFDGYVLRATGATTFAWQRLDHGDLSGVGENNHHNRQHVITDAADHTVDGSQWDLIGLTGADTLGLLTPSDGPGATEKILKTDASGYLAIQAFKASVIPSTTKTHALGSSAAIWTHVWGYNVHVAYDATTKTALATDMAGDLWITPTGGDIKPEANLIFQGAHSITTSADSLTIAPAADLVLTPGGNDVIVTWGAGKSFTSSDYASKTTGWGISYGSSGGHGDFRSLYADELHVQAFIADIYQALVGGIVVTKSRAKLSRDFTIPANTASGTLYVEDLEGWENTQLFVASDVVRLRYVDTSGGGLIVTDVWGVVTAYTDLTGGEQSYTFTTSDDGGVSGSKIYAGAIALDYGQAGSGSKGIWEATVLDAAGAPYSQIATWATNPWTPANWTTRVRLGNLDGISGVGLEYGLWAGQNTSDTFLLLSDSSFEVHGLDIKLYDGASNTVRLDPATPSFAMGVTLPTGYGVGDGIWMGKDTTYKFRVGDVDGERVQWDSTNGLRIFNHANEAVITLGSDGTAEIESRVLVNMGDTGVFSDNGLLLLGPGCELTSTSWKSLRGQEATIANAFQTMRGAFPGTQGIVMEPGCTNLITNPSIEVDTTGYITYGTNTIARSDEQAKYEDHSLKCTYQDSTYLAVYGITLTAALHYASCWIWVPTSWNGGNIFLRMANFAGASYVADREWNYLTSPRNTWFQLVSHITPLAGDLSGHVQLFVSVVPTAGCYVYTDGWQTEVSRLTTTCIGSMPWCAWSGAAHASPSTRTGTTMVVPTASNISATKGSISIRFRLSTVHHPGGGYLFSAGDVNAELDAYVDPTAGDIIFKINGATRCNGGAAACDIDHCATFEWDSAEDDSWLYLDGVLIDTGTCGGAAPTLHENISIGYSVPRGVAYNLCGVVTEFAVFDDLLSADEVAANWNLRRPIIDHGAMDAPGLYIMDGKFRVASSYTGTRIDITPDEIAGFSGATKQFYLSAEDGKAYAGAGAVALNEDGIEIPVTTSYDDLHAYKFMNSGGIPIARLAAYVDDDYQDISVFVDASAGRNSWAHLQAESQHGDRAICSLWSLYESGADASYFAVEADNLLGNAIWWAVDENWGGQFESAHTKIFLADSAETGVDVRQIDDWEIIVPVSVRAAKTNIQDFTADRGTFMRLRPTSYNAIENPGGKTIIGLVAEEVAEALPGLATYLRRPPRTQGRMKGKGSATPQLVNWDDKQMLVTAISVIQQQEEDIVALQGRVAVLEAV